MWALYSGAGKRQLLNSLVSRIRNGFRLPVSPCQVCSISNPGSVAHVALGSPCAHQRPSQVLQWLLLKKRSSNYLSIRSSRAQCIDKRILIMCLCLNGKWTKMVQPLNSLSRRIGSCLSDLVGFQIWSSRFLSGENFQSFHVFAENLSGLCWNFPVLS